ncbi:MAG TPA: TMEM165/GDT1 family protein [Allocoleopsis sp.]
MILSDIPSKSQSDLFQQPTKRPEKNVILTVFFSTFVTIFLAEMGDKTQLATLLISAESQSPWLVFLGAGTALIATSLVGVLLGKWLSKFVPPRTLDILAAISLLFISITLFWELINN